MLPAKACVPLGEWRWPEQIAVGDLAAGVSRTVAMPAGCLVEARLAADLERAGRKVAWLRPARYEVDAMLQEQARPEDTVVVQPAAGSALPLPAEVPTASSLVLVCGGPEGLRVGVSDTVSAAEQLGSPFPPATLARLVAAADGRAMVIDSVLRASCERGWRELAAAVHEGQDICGLLADASLRVLATAGQDRIDALVLAAHLGYAHPRLRALAPALQDPATEPWWQPLDGGWYRMLPLWGTALLALPARRTAGFQGRLARLVGELEGERADREAVELCVRLGAFELQADLLAASAETLARAGDEDLVRSWLAVLPDRVLRQRDLARLWAAIRLRPVVSSRADARDEDQAWTVAWMQACAALADGRAEAALACARRARAQARRSSARAAADRAGLLARRIRRFVRTRSVPKRMRLLLQVTEFAQCQAPGPAGDAAPPEGTQPVLVLAARPPGPSAAVQAVAAVDVQVRLLGAFRLQLQGQEVTGWSGNLGRSVLKYLLLQWPRPVPRDVLTEVFWPGVPASAARNRLNVALYALRRDLREVSSRTVVVHARETYLVAPDLTVLLDVEEFGRQASAAMRLRSPQTPDLADAVRCHERATALYAGDLLEDTPCADWAVPERERLAQLHLDLLEGLAGLYLQQGAYPACVETSRRLLMHDPCREEAHRLLMRAFVRQNQPHRAAAQFESLRRELDGTLGMTPGPETVRLYESVRRHRLV
ncbi:BTAD domain-containing putative transcriptional regulator [Streptomyces sp. HUAS ZL42]|uniref:AfsR/SARP family transcriptional regulator n=1 Tax=Streptomyces sp. HUAS ZL42 TaxID=3231715 RepID=UPI00345E635F